MKSSDTSKQSTHLELTLKASHPGEPHLGEMTIGNITVTVVGQLTADRHDQSVEPVPAWLIAEDDSDTYRDLVAAFPQSGLWPVRDLQRATLRGRDAALHDDHSRSRRSGAPVTTIRQAFGLDGMNEWEVQEEDFCFECGPLLDHTGDLAIGGTESDAEILARALEDPGNSFQQGGEVYWRESSHSPIALVPVARAADFPVIAGWNGAVNYPRETEEMAIILRSWEDRFGAYAFSAGTSTMEIAVARPPRSIEDARLLARELLHFCPYDTQFHGTGGIEPYARSLVGSHWWRFWWD